jgi:transposase
MGMEAYSLDLRERILAAVDAGKLTRTQIARLFQVSGSWLRRLVQRRRDTGSIAPIPQRHGPLPTLTERQRQRLQQLVQRTPDATLAELRDRLGVAVTTTTIWRELKKLGLTRKKSPCMPANKTVPKSSGNAPSSGPNCTLLIPAGSSFSTRRGPVPT